MIDLKRLSEELRAAGSTPDAAVYPVDVDRTRWPARNTTWHARDADGVIVRLDWQAAPTTPQVATAASVIAAHDGTPTESDRLDGLALPTRVQAAIVLRLSASWTTATAQQKGRVQAVLDQAGARVLALLT